MLQNLNGIKIEKKPGYYLFIIVFIFIEELLIQYFYLIKYLKYYD
jgi:hypothetical protein